MSDRYDRERQIATSAAREAGALLRAEFTRPGGPRGPAGKCPADAEAEALIRRTLGDAFPDYGLVGEELGDQDRLPRDADRHTWLVDPNDGTAAMQKGTRGASVSIALLRDGQPVLGVVFCYAPPIGAEDLFAWAEGQPLTRNGRVVDRRPLRVPAPDDTVAVSQAADKDSEANALLVMPARFRAVASIAYRLALVAAGECEAATSLGGPVAWDYAAGHALLRAVGGELFDQDGRPVTYTADGRSACRNCFGGARELGEAYAAKSWDTVFHPVSPEKPFDLLWPEPGAIVADAAMLDRAQGCLIGQIAGDALGSLVEFQSSREIAARHPDGIRLLSDGGTWNTIAGQPTDDSELAMMLARSIVKEGRFDESAAAGAYAHWYASRPFDVGNATRAALMPAAAALRAGRDPAVVAQTAASVDTQANGALMRVSPLGIFGAGMPPAHVAEFARRDAALTHPHPVCRDASAVFAVTVAHAIRTGEPAAKVYAFARQWARAASLHEDVIDSIDEASSGPPDDYVQKMGWVRIALRNAYFQLLRAGSIEAGVVDTVMRGGDTDTNAAIAGALLGAVYGAATVPLQWRDRVLTCRPIRDLPRVQQPRPRCFWPVDALVLAERLLWLGTKS